MVIMSGLPSPALAQKSNSSKVANSPYLKLSEPWPDADTVRARKIEAEQRPLFASDEPLMLTLSADFKAVNADRTESSGKRFPATLSIGPEGGPTIPVKLGTRGHFRLRHANCTQVPLRVEFPKKESAGTVFDGQSALKLVTHCRDNYEQHVLREYLVYRIHALVAKLAFRVRLAKITYVDTNSGKPAATRYGMFLEDDRDVARRAEARAIELPRSGFKDLDAEALNTMAVFEYMIGNTDVSIFKLHNVKLMVTPSRTIYPVPYDFDFSGLVDAPYANPEPKLGISSVRDRLYRGPCRTEPEFEAVLDKFRRTKNDVMALYDSLPDLTPGYRKQARAYLEDFYAIIGRPDRAKKALVDGCVRAETM
jgi:hypothetical protein